MLFRLALLARHCMMRQKTHVAAGHQKYWDLKEPMVLANLRR